MKRICLFVLSLSFLITSVRGQGLVSAKSVVARVNTLPFFETKTARVAAPAMAKGRTVWRETFADNQHSWKTGKVKTGNLNLTANGYQIQTENRETDAVSLIDTPFDLNSSDFILETSVDNTGDTPPNIGIIVGGDVDRYFVFRINYLSKFTAQYVTADKKPYTAEDFVFNTNIATGSNKLKMEKTGNTINFYINNEKVYTRLFQPLGGQQIGLIGAGRNAIVKNVLLIGTAK